MNDPYIKVRFLAEWFNTPLGVITVLSAIIATVESLLLFAEGVLAPAIFSVAIWNFVNVALLTLILAPVLYFLVFRKMQESITECRRNQDEIQASENRYRTLVDTAIDGIIMIDAKGCIQTFNPAAISLFGYLPEEVKGKNVSVLMPEPYANEHDGYLHNYFTTGNQKIIGISREVVGQRKDGSTFPIDLAVVEMNIHGERLITGIMRDITTRKRAAAESANLIKSQFLSRMSHELRTPLNAIIGFSQLIEVDALASGEDGNLGNVRDVLKASRHLLSLVNAVLDFTQLGTGTLRIEPSQTNLLMVAIDTIGAVHQLAEARKIEVRLINRSLENHGEIWADPLRTKQALLNLLSNAIKYNKEGGSIEVALETLNSEFVRLSVLDSGIGIPGEDIDELFLPFSRLHTNNHFVEGAGLGLSITKELVEEMGGRIGIKSVKDVGSTFWIDMPIYRVGSRVN